MLLFVIVKTQVCRHKMENSKVYAGELAFRKIDTNFFFKIVLHLFICVHVCAHVCVCMYMWTYHVVSVEVKGQL